MADISLVKQLSGSEALASMLEELRKRLRMNGRFQPHMAYSGYRAKITVEFYPAMTFVPPVEQTVELEEVPEGATVSLVATVSQAVEIPLRSPNEARESADMPTPFLTQDQNGNPVEKWVKKGPGAGQRPKNVVKGGQVGSGSREALVGEGTTPAVTMVPNAIPVP